MIRCQTITTLALSQCPAIDLSTEPSSEASVLILNPYGRDFCVYFLIRGRGAELQSMLMSSDEQLTVVGTIQFSHFTR